MAKKVFVVGAAGRIGRGITHELVNLIEDYITRQEQGVEKNVLPLELVGLGDIIPVDALIESYTERDPVHGIYAWDVRKMGDWGVRLRGQEVKYFCEKDLSKVPFKNLGVDIVLECSGVFGDPKNEEKPTPEQNISRQFLKYGAGTVIQTYPAKSADATLVMGVNHHLYDPSRHKIISNASCTTKALAVPLQVLIDKGIEIDTLSMDTTHAATASQKVLESLGQILTHSTGAAKATGSVIPSLKGKMAGMSYRVPTLDGSFANLYFVASCDCNTELNADLVNEMIRNAVSNPRYAERLGVFKGKDAGTFDIVGRRENAVVIPSKTVVQPLTFSKQGKNSYLVTLISGYDNELGSSIDPVLLAEYIARKSYRTL